VNVNPAAWQCAVSGLRPGIRHPPLGLLPTYAAIGVAARDASRWRPLPHGV